MRVSRSRSRSTLVRLRGQCENGGDRAGDGVIIEAAEQITWILERSESGEAGATDQLLPLLYQELHALAESRLAREPPGQTLQATALVHEAYLKLAGGDEEVRRWDSRGHFFAAAGRAMRQILVDRARRRQTLKHGGDRARLTLESLDVAQEASPIDDEALLALDTALQRLEQQDSRKARIVTLRHFAGLSLDQTAEVLGLSRTTIKDEWSFARAWLRSEITRHG